MSHLGADAVWAPAVVALCLIVSVVGLGAPGVNRALHQGFVSLAQITWAIAGTGLALSAHDAWCVLTRRRRSRLDPVVALVVSVMLPLGAILLAISLAMAGR